MERMRLLVGGPTTEWTDELTNGQLTGPWAAADRGALRLLEMGQVPVLTVGDFDSMTSVEREETLAKLTRVVSVKPEKDETDLELLLTLVEKDYQPESIEIYGATGGRIDHLLSNIWIFTEPRFKDIASKVTLIDRTNQINFYYPGSHAIQHTPGMDYVGFMPLTPVTGLTLVDEKYKLTDWQGNPYSFSSNEFVGDINHFKFDSGVVAVIQSRDLNGRIKD